nr:hypothetical protein [Tanacetum cinerariifolium]GEX21009.1 hypothetical protein [Tanacetum cinerariifolium]
MHNEKERIAGFSTLLGETKLYQWFSGKSFDLIVVELENRMVKEDCIHGLAVSPAQAIIWRLMITYLVFTCLKD